MHDPDRPQVKIATRACTLHAVGSATGEALDDAMGKPLSYAAWIDTARAALPLCRTIREALDDITTEEQAR